LQSNSAGDLRPAADIRLFPYNGFTHRISAEMAGAGGFEIKREEKYLVFIWMSRSERMVAEKMAHYPIFLKRVLVRRLSDPWPKTVFGEIKKDGRPEEQNQGYPHILSPLISEWSRKDIPQDDEQQTHVDYQPEQTERNQTVELA
jgi:hypothetical protein